MDAVVERGFAVEARLLPYEEFPLVFRVHGWHDRAIGLTGRDERDTRLGPEGKQL